MKQTIKTLKQWEKSGKNLDEFLRPGDWISEDLCNYIGEIVPPYYCSCDFVQGGESIKSEDNVLFYCTCYKTEDNRYLYLGVLPEFKQ